MDEEFEEDLAKEWKAYNDRGAATVDALEDNTQELAFAKGFKAGVIRQKEKDFKVLHKSDISPFRKLFDIFVDDTCTWLLQHNNYLENQYYDVISFNMAKLVTDFRKAANEKWIEKKK